MQGLAEKIQAACQLIHTRWDSSPSLGLVLGTGLGDLAQQIDTAVAIPYEEIPHFPASTAPSHAGRLVCGELQGVPLVAMEGRFHYYEGYSLAEVTFPIRVMKSLGAGTLLLTNAAGGLNPEFVLGDVVAIADQINLLGDNPLRGVNDDSLGPRFPDMCDPYDPELITVAQSCAEELGMRLPSGVFIALVGMSTVPECLVARHAGMRVMGFSIVTDMGLPEELEPVNIEMVLDVAGRGGEQLAKLIPRIVAQIG